MDRRSFVLAAAGGTLMTLDWRRALAAGLPAGAIEAGTLEALPGKVPLIKRSLRPPNFETPVDLFDSAITPNRAFFVRWHLADIPEVNPTAWRLKVGGAMVTTPAEYSLDQLKRGFEQVELVAVCQCSGNRRGLSDPHVPGVEWGYGAMGNARWKGVRLRDVLNKAGLKKDVVEVAFNGAETGASPATPDFNKSIPPWKAQDENTLLVWEMNGEPLPHLNGAPLRVIVPGWTATYWMKMLMSIDALDKPINTFWMNTAYRVPKGKFGFADRFLSQESDVSTPITEMVVNSLITNIKDGQRDRCRPGCRRARHCMGRAAMASATSTCRRMAGARGTQPTWARTLAAFRSAPGATGSGRRRRAIIRSWHAPPIARAPRRPPSSSSILPAITTT